MGSSERFEPRWDGGQRGCARAALPSVQRRAGAGGAAFGAPLGAGGFRTRTISSISGANWPPMTRSVEVNFIASLFTRVMVWVAEVALPSRSEPWALTIHWSSPTRVQYPSPWPPSESNDHDLSWLVLGSQPMIITPL